jgi:hypothetical protein
LANGGLEGIMLRWDGRMDRPERSLQMGNGKSAGG